MRKIRFFLVIIFILNICAFPFKFQGKSLSDIYRQGKIRFISKLTLDDHSLPNGMFFESPSDITFDENNNLYVCDYKAHNIKKFNAAGMFVGIIGKKGQGPGEFNWPYRISAVNGNNGSKRF